MFRVPTQEARALRQPAGRMDGKQGQEEGEVVLERRLRGASGGAAAADRGPRPRPRRPPNPPWLLVSNRSYLPKPYVV